MLPPQNPGVTHISSQRGARAVFPLIHPARRTKRKKRRYPQNPQRKARAGKRQAVNNRRPGPMVMARAKQTLRWGWPAAALGAAAMLLLSFVQAFAQAPANGFVGLGGDNSKKPIDI